MNTVVLEILRLGSSYNYNLSPEQKYLALCGSYPHVELSFNCDQRTFNRNIRQLRYSNTEESRISAISFFQEILKEPLNKLEALRVEGNKDRGPLHLRLVTTAKELMQIPFELALTPSGFEGENTSNFLLNPQCPTTLTREIRQVKSPSYHWPFFPRILFVYAEPLESVPHDAHTKVFVEVLTELANPIPDSPDCVPDLAPLVTIVRKASLRKIQNEIEKGVEEKKPYTHVHLLAHGIKAEDDDLEFRLLLHDSDHPEKPYSATGKELVQSLSFGGSTPENLPSVVSFMVCDSGNEGSPVVSSGSLAFELHEGGIPCVFASQFPLTQDGSVSLARTLYEKLLLDGQDPRVALISIRQQLSNHFHDWGSLVALVRFPDDMENQLQDSQLKLLFKSMKVAQSWSEYLLKNERLIKPDKVDTLHKKVSFRLEKAINSLESCLENGQSTRLSPILKTEHFGLLGSAYKRKAEFTYMRLPNSSGDDFEKLQIESRVMLEKAIDFYNLGFNALISSHWNGMQYLSLKAVLKGSLVGEEELWTVIHFMAEKEKKNAQNNIDLLWSYGTLVELYLLKPLIVQDKDFKFVCNDSLSRAKLYYKSIRESGNQEVLESTQRQLGRYIDWWPAMYPDTYRIELKKMAEIIMGIKNSSL